MDPDDLGNAASSTLDTLFGYVQQGANVYSQFDAARDKVNSQNSAQTSNSPLGTTTNAAGQIVMSPQTIAVAVGAVALVAVLLIAARK